VTDAVEPFARRYPMVWHVIEAEGAGTAELLPSAALRRLAGLRNDGCNRDDFVPVMLAADRRAVLRPQLMRDEALRPSLSGVFADQPAAWRAHVDNHVFFWTCPARRDRFIAAVMRWRRRSRTVPAGGPPVILALDTAALLRHHAARSFFSNVNIGSTLRGGARVRRDEHTLRPVAAYRGGRVAELAVRGPVGLPGILQGMEAVAAFA
jgi:hypothetical protein